jgi:hypothetical protein
MKSRENVEPSAALALPELKARVITGINRVNSLQTQQISTSAVMTPLTPKEKGQLKKCEDTIRSGMGIFFEVGRALLTIREGRLYRASHSSFEAYCHERWGFGRSYASRVIGAAERLNLLPANCGVRRPTNEFQIRPFLKLEAEAFPKAWQEASKRANNGKLTANLVQAVIREISGNRDELAPTEICSRPACRRPAPLGQILALLTQTRRSIQQHDTDLALATLDTIEDLLFGDKHAAKPS